MQDTAVITQSVGRKWTFLASVAVNVLLLLLVALFIFNATSKSYVRGSPELFFFGQMGEGISVQGYTYFRNGWFYEPAPVRAGVRIKSMGCRDAVFDRDTIVIRLHADGDLPFNDKVVLLSQCNRETREVDLDSLVYGSGLPIRAEVYIDSLKNGTRKQVLGLQWRGND